MTAAIETLDAVAAQGSKAAAPPLALTEPGTPLMHLRPLAMPLLAALLAASSAWAADKAGVPPPAAYGRIVMLGTGGGPILRANRAEPSILLQVGGRSYLIDTGIGSLRNLYALGLRASDIDAVFITHHHLDHDGGLVDLLEQSSFERRRDPVDIVGPVGTTSQVSAATTFMAPSRRIFANEGFPTPAPESIFKARDLGAETGPVYRDGQVRVIAVENSHFRFVAQGGDPKTHDRSYSFRFETPGRVVVFTGDTGSTDRLVDLARSADVLVSEVVDVPGALRFAIGQIPGVGADGEALRNHMALEHLIPEEIGRLATRAGVKMVVLTHFSPGLDSEEDLRKYTDGVRMYYSGQVVASRDLEEF